MHSRCHVPLIRCIDEDAAEEEEDEEEEEAGSDLDEEDEEEEEEDLKGAGRQPAVTSKGAPAKVRVLDFLHMFACVAATGLFSIQILM
jgi:hypothetical protein